MEAASQLAVKGSLPKRLIDFFARYPPRLYGVYFTNETVQQSRTQTTRERSRNAESTKSKSKKVVQQESPLTSVATAAVKSQPEPSVSESEAPVPDSEGANTMFESVDKGPNPFLPYRNPATGRWRGAHVSLRRQAELFKLARYYGVEPLLPASRKSTYFKEQRLLERAAGVRADGTEVKGMRGTGVGQEVKGHIWERKMGSVLERRITAMEKMPELIREWRQRGNGKQWKKFPSSKKMKV